MSQNNSHTQTKQKERKNYFLIENSIMFNDYAVLVFYNSFVQRKNIDHKSFKY